MNQLAIVGDCSTCSAMGESDNTTEMETTMNTARIMFLTFCVVVTLAVLALGGAGVYAYKRYQHAPSFAAADFEAGGSVVPAERVALIDACSARTAQKPACECVGEKADKDLSRFDRIQLTATYNGDLNRLADIIMGGVKSMSDKQAEANTSEPIAKVLKACNASLDVLG